jgi:outer membrane biosynthesis protein TonB
LLLALVLSMLFHSFVLLTFPVPEGRAVVPREAPIEIALIEQPKPVVQPEKVKPQIVSPPDQVNEEPPPDDTRFQSDHDNVVLEQTVRKGVPNPAPPKPPREAQPEVREKPAEAERQTEREQKPPTDQPRAEARSGHAPALEDLFASTDELVRAQQGDRAREEAAQQHAAENAESERRLALALAPAVPEWSLPGTSGTLDHLPDIQRGDVTLLNTKANVFAPFVRRVGERVFQHLIIRQRRLELEQILSARESVQLRVLLDPRGRLKSVKLESQSGSATMDDTLGDAVDTAAFDNNPPPAAANTNGDYEFIFQARLRAFQPGPGGRPSRIESRLSVALL